MQAEALDSAKTDTGRGNDGAVGADAIADVLDVLDDVLGLCKVDPRFGTELEAEGLLFCTGVCANGLESDLLRFGGGSPMATTRRPIWTAYWMAVYALMSRRPKKNFNGRT